MALVARIGENRVVLKVATETAARVAIMAEEETLEGETAVVEVMAATVAMVAVE